MSSKLKVESSRLDETAAGGTSAPSNFEPATFNFELEVADLRKSFREPSGGALEVLRGASLGLRAGEAAAVVGASGAGKTTLLHVVGGLEAADAGRVRLGGFDVTRASPSELVRWRGGAVGFVFQFHHLLADLSAEENVALPLLVARAGRREASTRARELLERVGLGSRLQHAAGELSGGEQQRVAVARALVTRPRLVLADEPTGNLDPRTGEEVGALLLSLCREARACALLATHNESLARLCDRRLLLREGQVTEAGAARPEVGVNESD